MSTQALQNAHAPDHWRELAAHVSFSTGCFIDGSFVPGDGSAGTFDTVNPSTGARVATFSSGSPRDVDRAVQSARRAFASWGRQPAEMRKKCLLAMAATVEARAADFALQMALEMGKPVGMGIGEAHAAARFLRYYGEAADKTHGEIAPTDPARGFTLTLREPWGVVGVIVPWNFPLMIACFAAAPALAAGNTVVLKPSEVTPSSALLLAQLAVEAGLPAGVLNVVPGLGATAGAALARHMDVDKLHFTGSTVVGRKMLEYAGQSNGKSVMLEVGGKSPQIVFRDAADVPGLAESLAASVFFNTGQVCVARSRLLVEEAIADEVVERLRIAAAPFACADPLDEKSVCGPVATRSQLERIGGYVDGAAREGAKLALAPRRRSESGCVFDPTILTNVDPSMRVVREEVFGPVLTVSTFRDDSRAVELANSTALGLAATAWTRDLDRALRLARSIDAGRVEVRAAASAHTPIEMYSAEPARGSGHGVIGGMRGLDAYVRHKAVELLRA